jgi:hypothetical protein
MQKPHDNSKVCRAAFVQDSTLVVVTQLGSCTERESLTGDAKGKGASGANREAESTDAPERGGLPCSSDEAG